MILKLIVMIILGIISAALSYYNKNYYVRIFDDILGKEEIDNVHVKIGRGFVYGFLFPIYFSLVVIGLIALVVFLIVAGVVAAIVFALVWITEKILPTQWLGGINESLLNKIGFSGPPPPPSPPSQAASVSTGTSSEGESSGPQ